MSNQIRRKLNNMMGYRPTFSIIILIQLICFSGLLICPAKCAPGEDLITTLPGLLKLPTFKQYSGYLDAIDGRKLHYWFVESELNPRKAPLVLWLNGGPGCSSIYGLLTEHGPFRVSEEGWALERNHFSWNKVANIIYLEAPAGVGFSYFSGENYTTNDNFTAENNFAALESFFDKFPEFSSNDFYITGESYGGFYVPTLAFLVAQHPGTFNLKGFMIGNGLHSVVLNANSAVAFARGHGEIDLKIMESLLINCCQPTLPLTCNFYNVTDPKCLHALVNASQEIALSGLNPYGIYKKCEYPEGGAHYLAQRFQPFGHLLLDESEENVGIDPPCVNSIRERLWMNQASVRTALHIPDHVQNWTVCSEEVGKSYHTNYQDMKWHYEQLIQKGLRGLVYHGDTDYMCSFMGGEWFVTSLKQPLLREYTRWTFDKQTAGYFKQFGNITYATVLGAGHMVPTDAPGQAFKLASNFLYNKPLD